MRMKCTTGLTISTWLVWTCAVLKGVSGEDVKKIRYKILMERVLQKDAATACQKSGGYLPILESPFTYQLTQVMSDLLNQGKLQMYHKFWIGLKWSPKEANWTSSHNGSVISPYLATRWNLPTNFSDEMCSGLRTNMTSEWFVDKLNCSIMHRTLCRYDHGLCKYTSCPENSIVPLDGILTEEHSLTGAECGALCLLRHSDRAVCVGYSNSSILHQCRLYITNTAPVWDSSHLYVDPLWDSHLANCLELHLSGSPKDIILHPERETEIKPCLKPPAVTDIKSSPGATFLTVPNASNTGILSALQETQLEHKSSTLESISPKATSDITDEGYSSMPFSTLHEFGAGMTSGFHDTDVAPCSTTGPQFETSVERELFPSSTIAVDHLESHITAVATSVQTSAMSNTTPTARVTESEYTTTKSETAAGQSTIPEPEIQTWSGNLSTTENSKLTSASLAESSPGKYTNSTISVIERLTSSGKPCSCFCGRGDSFTDEEKIQWLKELLNDLTIDVKNTSSYKSQFISVDDPRPSARGCGYVAVAFLTTVIATFILMDTVTMVTSLHSVLRRRK